MELKQYLEHLNQGEMVTGNSDIHKFMTKLSQEAMKITIK